MLNVGYFKNQNKHNTSHCQLCQLCEKLMSPSFNQELYLACFVHLIDNEAGKQVDSGLCSQGLEHVIGGIKRWS